MQLVIFLNHTKHVTLSKNDMGNLLTVGNLEPLGILQHGNFVFMNFVTVEDTTMSLAYVDICS
jgi:hypothetical protein